MAEYFYSTTNFYSFLVILSAIPAMINSTYINGNINKDTAI